jgi:broad specificity phosphatase PhoE
MKRAICFFVRHGETDLNKKDEFRGDLDVPLDKDGEQQAAALVPFFKNKEFSGAYGSTRLRVQQTMKPLMEAKGMKMKPLKALDSLDTGEFAGKPKDKENLKELKWYREHPQEEIPGGEKVQDFRGRVDAKIMSLIRKGESSAKPIVAGVHGSVIKEINRLLHDDMDFSKVEPGGVLAVFKSPTGYSTEALLKPAEESEEIYAGS